MRGFLFVDKIIMLSFEILIKNKLMAKKLTQKEKRNRGTLKFLNLKILPNNGVSDYIDLLKVLPNFDYRVKVRKNQFVAFTKLTTELDGKILIGNLIEYTSLDPEGYIDLETKESVDSPFNKSIGGNREQAFFYFIPEAHRIVMFKNSKININSVHKYFDTAVNLYFKEKGVTDKEFFIYLIKSDDLIEALEQAYLVTYLKAKLTYTNKDNTKGFTEIFTSSVENSGANAVNVELKTDRGNSLSMEKDSLPRTLTELSKENGEIEARVIEYEGGKIKKINTEEYPLEEQIEYTKNNIFQVIYEKVMSRWRSDDE